MKKYGKYEKMPEGVAAKKSTAKSVLLQTYFISLICLVLCVAMFFGTSYAWFTSEVTNVGNEIYIGTLDVELKKHVGTDWTAENWKSMSDRVDGVNTTRLFDGSIKWEPGYTALETLRITNEGDLAFKYVLSFTDGVAIDPAANAVDLQTVAKYFDVWVYDHGKHGVEAENFQKPASYDKLTEEGSGWELAGSLDQLLAGAEVLEGNMVTVLDADGGIAATSDTYTIALHMKETADASIMGHKISLNVKLVAYQKAAEIDGLGNKDYDQIAYTEADLRAAFRKGGRVIMMENIKLTEELLVEPGVAVVLDLNGKKLSYDSTEQGEAMITNKGTLTINDETGDGVIHYNYTGEADPSYGKGNYTISNAGKMTLNGGSITIAKLASHAKYPIDNNSTTGDAVLVINGGYLYNYNTSAIRQFCNSTTYQNSVTINGGKIEGYSVIWMQNPGAATVNGNLTINGGEFKTTAKAYVDNSADLKDVNSGIYCSVATGGAWSATSGINISGGVFYENLDLAKNAPAVTVTGGDFHGRCELPNNG